MLRTNKSPGTVVGANVKLQGTLRDTQDIIIYGQVEGEVISDETVTVEENASIKGPVNAQVVLLSGTIKGALDAKEKLEIHPTGRLSGSVNTANLIIHSGAIFNGKSVMTEKESRKTSPAKETLESEIKAKEAFADLDVELE